MVDLQDSIDCPSCFGKRSEANDSNESAIFDPDHLWSSVAAHIYLIGVES